MNPFSDTIRFLTANTGDFNSLGAWKYLLLLLFYALLAVSFAAAIRNWREDPSQRTAQNFGTCLIRVLVGCMWFEGMLWKLPFSEQNGFHYWLEQLAGRAAFAVHRDFVANVLLPHYALVNPLVFLAELVFAVSLILGLGVRLVSSVAILFVLNLWLGIYVRRGPEDPAEWSWSYMFLAMLLALFVLHAAGRSLGVDAWLRRHVAAVRKGTGLVGSLFRLAS
jgi:uncharacterized membrane protein YphA (DoxX/SURF4 family)